MWIHIIACRVLTRELSYFASQSPHTVDITWLPQGLHDTPAKLRMKVSETIDSLYEQWEKRELKHMPDVIVLGYGLCSNGVVGIQARDIPLVVPRTDDCIALFLGSQQRYLELFHAYAGTFWLNSGWVETAFIPTQKLLEQKRREYAENYGEDNADFLMEQDMLWAKNYRYIGYITSPIYDAPVNRDTAREAAGYNGWSFQEFQGDPRLVQKMTTGEWEEKEFLICPPHHRIEASYDGGKVCAVPCEESTAG